MDSTAVMAARGHTGVVEGYDYRGVRVLSAIEPVPNTSWFVLTEIDVAEALAARKRDGAVIAGFAALLLLLTAAVATLSWQVQRRSLGEARLAETALGESEAQHGATLRSVGDGVIATDTAARVTLMSPVAETTTGWSQADAMGWPLTEVFCIVNERTGETAENPAERVMGLATVYGIVSQNGGWVDVDSEPGHGSTFQVYMPPATAAAQRAAAPRARAHKMTRGSETILIAEDEPTILNLAERVLARYGYSVLKAKSPQQAIEISREHGGLIDLIITDVVMPEMNGKDLYDQIVSLRPGIRAIFMSGYAGDTITDQGVLQDGILFLQKPFRAHALLASVRDALDGNGRGAD